MHKLIATAFLLLPNLVWATQFFVAPTGSPTNDGSFGSPWDLQTALDHPSTVLPGDTIWLRGGTYFGNPVADANNVAGFISHLKGSADQPIIVRQYPGERAILDGGNRPHPVVLNSNFDSYTLGVLGDYTWYWGFEVTNSNPHSRADSMALFKWRVRSVILLGTANRLINLVVHDTGNGLESFSGCTECEYYGNIVFYNGWSNLGVRGHGEGMYCQNSGPTKYIRDNIVFKQFDSGIIIYGSVNAMTDNFHLEGNVVFANGAVNDDPNGWGFLLGKNGGAPPGNNFTIQNNFLYNRFDYLRSNNIDMGYQSGLNNVLFKKNYSAGRWAVRNNLPVTGFSATGNTLIGQIYPVSAAQISADSNTILPASPLPTQNAVFVRPNLYEPGRAHIVVYNWLNLPTVAVNLTEAGLAAGEAFEVFDVQNLFAAPVASGIYSPTAPEIVLLMSLSEVMPVIGENVPKPAVHTDPVFNVFLLKKSLATIPTTQPDAAAVSFSHRFDPTTRQLTVQATAPGQWQLALFDIAGKLLLEKSFSGTETTMDLSHLAAGVYVVSLSNGREKGSGKLFVRD